MEVRGQAITFLPLSMYLSQHSKSIAPNRHQSLVHSCVRLCVRLGVSCLKVWLTLPMSPFRNCIICLFCYRYDFFSIHMWPFSTNKNKTVNLSRQTFCSSCSPAPTLVAAAVLTSRRWMWRSGVTNTPTLPRRCMNELDATPEVCEQTSLRGERK